MSIKDRLMEQTLVYRLWMAPFADKKFAPVARNADLNSSLRVLDVGCGPGTNARYFRECEYVGIDINPRYIESAQRRHEGTFLVADATKPGTLPDGPFELVLVNSFLHHVPEEAALRTLETLQHVLAGDGHIHVIELVLPDERGIPRWLAKADRGDFPKRVEGWTQLFEQVFDPLVVEPFPLKAGGITLWEMVYLKGRPRVRSGRGLAS